MTVRGRLASAIGTGEVLRIAYHGGSQPGAVRDIAPIGFEGHKIRARCYTSGAVKAFVIDKIEVRGVVPTPEDVANKWQHGRVVLPQFNTLADVMAAHGARLEALGWIVANDTDDFGESINLRQTFKNGKLIQTPVASLTFQPVGVALIATEEGDIVTEQTGPRQRPWIVRAKGLPQAKTYGDSGKAVELFLKCAEELAPRP